MDRGAWWATVHGVTKGWTWPSDSVQHTAHNSMPSYGITPGAT